VPVTKARRFVNLVLFEKEELSNSADSESGGQGSFYARLAADDPRARHIATVLRLGEGQRFRAGILGGRLAEGLVLSSGKTFLELRLDLAGESPKSLPVSLILGHPRPIVLRRMLRDLASMGIAELIVCNTELGERSYFQSKLWEGAAVRRLLAEGAAQGGTTRLPRVRRSGGIGEAVELLAADARPRWALDNGAGTAERLRSLFDLKAELSVGGPLGGLVAAIGAERGFTDAERASLAGADFRFLAVGNHILRTETAMAVLYGMLHPVPLY
jgi:RsmE family RNA methyltransferase